MVGNPSRADASEFWLDSDTIVRSPQTKSAGCNRGNAPWSAPRRAVDPIRDWNGSNVASFSAQVHDCPLPLALLKVVDGQTGYFVATQSAGEQYRQERPIPFALDPLAIRCLPEYLPLFGAQPVTESHTKLLDALHPPNASRQVGA